MKLTRTNDERYFEFEREGFGTLILTANEVCFICNQMTKINLRDSIGYKLDELNGDMIDIEKYPDGDREDFLDEKGIDIPNPEKEQSDCPSTIYGTDYGILSDRIETLLVRLGYMEGGQP